MYGIIPICIGNLMARQLTNGLTARQREIFAFINFFSSAHGFPPTIREIGSHFKIAPSSALDHLRALERKGYIKRLPFKPRCLELLKPVSEP